MNARRPKLAQEHIEYRSWRERTIRRELANLNPLFVDRIQRLTDGVGISRRHYSELPATQQALVAELEDSGYVLDFKAWRAARVHAPEWLLAWESIRARDDGPSDNRACLQILHKAIFREDVDARCPGCGSEAVGRHTNKRGLHQCRVCRRQSSLLGLSQFARLRVGNDLWFLFWLGHVLVRDGRSRFKRLESSDLPDSLGISYRTRTRYQRRVWTILVERQGDLCRIVEGKARKRGWTVSKKGGHIRRSKKIR